MIFKSSIPRLCSTASQTSHSVTTVVSTVHGCFFSYGSLPSWLDHRALLSDLSSCPHLMSVSGPASESATFASSSGFNQQFSPHWKPQPVAYCTLMSRESRNGPSRSSHRSCICFFFHITGKRAYIQQNYIQWNAALCRTSRQGWAFKHDICPLTLCFSTANSIIY